MKETFTRMITGIIFGAIVIAAVALGPWSNAVLWIVVSSLAVREFMQGSQKASPSAVWGFSAFVALWMCMVLGIPWCNSGAYEPSALLSLIFIIWTNDSGAYFVGKPFGKHKLMPHVSPGKSWEGLFGGAVFASLMAWCLLGGDFFWMGLLVAVLATAGDLIESAWKRRNGIKDSGKLMPGHGGVLDRFDGFMLTGPVYLVLLSLLSFEFTLKTILP